MPELLEANQRSIAQDFDETGVVYASNWEYLADELVRLDLLIQLSLLSQQRRNPPDLLDQFKGLVISDEEVARLLTETSEQRATSGFSRAGHQQQADEAERAEVLASLDDVDRRIRQRRRASHQAAIHFSLPVLTRLFGLTPFEEQCVVACLARELDRRYEKLYAYLQDDVTRRKPSVALLLDLFCHSMAEKISARAVFDSQSPLLRHKLLQMGDGSAGDPSTLLSRSLKLDDRIVNFLLGFNRTDERLESVARLIVPNTQSDPLPVNEELRERIAGFIQTQIASSDSAGGRAVFYLYNSDGADSRALATAVSHDFGLPLLTGDVEPMVNGQNFEEAVWLFAREATLQPAMLCLENADCLLNEPEKHHAKLRLLFEAVHAFSRIVFLCGNRAWQPLDLLNGEMFIAIDLNLEDRRSGSRLWERQLRQDHLLAEEVDWEALTSKFKLAPSRIREAMAMAQTLARWRSPAEPRITADDLHRACRAQSTPKLEALARKIEPKYKWQDIILPDDQQSQLREICDQARHRQKVYGDWGFGRKLSRGRGLNALFTGPPGTGKTMAAEVIATELQLDLYQIDLSQVVSKYIGETEKNLHRIFAEAQSSSAILFFDEADALFGKRSEVKDAHDRYANIEVGYLLQKMEEYEGIAILATNLRQHLDEAFARRMQFIVEFPFPDEDSRRRIWQVTFPVETPLAVEVDFNLLAREIKLAGGNIKNIGLAAAFYAAGNGGMVGISHLAQAVRRELQKMGRAWDTISYLKED